MGNGIPLTDQDRWDWLIALREEALRVLQTSNSVIVTCSALKHKYRDVMRIANYEHPSVQVHFLYLALDEETMYERLAARKGHYMKLEMMKSQIAALEEPDEEWDVLRVDVKGDQERVSKNALEVVRTKLKEYEALDASTNS